MDETYTWNGTIGDVVRMLSGVSAAEFKQAMSDIVDWLYVDIAGVSIWRIGPDEYVVVGPYRKA